MEINYPDIISGAREEVATERAKQILEELKNSDIGINNSSELIEKIINSGFSDVFPIRRLLVSLFSIIALFSVLNLFKAVVGKSESFNVLKYIISVLANISVVLPFYQMLYTMIVYMRDVSNFFAVISPTLGIITAMGGNVESANVQTLTYSIILSAIQFLLNHAIPIVLSVLLGISVIDVLSSDSSFTDLAKAIKNGVFGLLVFFTSLFYIFISIYGQAARGSDTLTTGAFRLLIRNAIPIIGNTISESLKVISGGIVAVKNSVGIASVVFILAMYLPILIVLWGSGLMFNISLFICNNFGASELKDGILHIKCATDFTLAAFSVITIVTLLNIITFLNTLPAVIQ